MPGRFVSSHSRSMGRNTDSIFAEALSARAAFSRSMESVTAFPVDGETSASRNAVTSALLEGSDGACACGVGFTCWDVGMGAPFGCWRIAGCGDGFDAGAAPKAAGLRGISCRTWFASAASVVADAGLGAVCVRYAGCPIGAAACGAAGCACGAGTGMAFSACLVSGACVEAGSGLRRGSSWAIILRMEARMSSMLGSLAAASAMICRSRMPGPAGRAHCESFSG